MRRGEKLYGCLCAVMLVSTAGTVSLAKSPRALPDKVDGAALSSFLRAPTSEILQQSSVAAVSDTCGDTCDVGYDDGVLTTKATAAFGSPGDRLAVGIVRPAKFSKLIAAKYFLIWANLVPPKPNGPFRVRVFRDSTGIPSRADLIPGTLTYLAPSQGWNSVPLASYNIIPPDDTTYVTLEYLTGPPVANQTPDVMVDAAVNQDGGGLMYSVGVGNWQSVQTTYGPSAGDLFIRGVFELPRRGDYGDAPDSSNGNIAAAGSGFPTQYFTKNATVIGRRGPFHRDTTQFWLGDSGNAPTRERNPQNNTGDGDRDSSKINGQFYTAVVGSDTLGWFIVPVSVAGSASAAVRVLNILYDQNKNGKWQNTSAAFPEWLVRNAQVFTNPGMTENYVLGPFRLKNVPPGPIWSRFTFTSDSIPQALFGTGWDGSGPDTGFAAGETEDFNLLGSVSAESAALVQVAAPVTFDAFEADTGRSTREVRFINYGGKALTASEIRFFALGDPDTNFILTLVDSAGQNSTNFTIPANSTVTFRYRAQFNRSSDDTVHRADRTRAFAWQLRGNSITTPLLSQAFTTFVEHVRPQFVQPVQNSFTRSACDFSFDFLVTAMDIDEEILFPLNIRYCGTCFRETVSLRAPVNLPTFFPDTVAALGTNNPGRFRWTPGVADTGVWLAKFVARDSVDKMEDTTDIFISVSATSATGVIAVRHIVVTVPESTTCFSVAVRVFNADFLRTIKIPLVYDSLICLKAITYDSTRLANSNILNQRFLDSTSYRNHNGLDTLVLTFFRTVGFSDLEPGCGTIANIWFSTKVTDTTVNPLDTVFINSSERPFFETAGGQEVLNLQFQNEPLHPQVLLGDLDCDTVRDINDIVGLINCVVFFPDPNKCTLCSWTSAGDVNLDGISDIVDITCLISNVVFNTSLPCQ